MGGHAAIANGSQYSETSLEVLAEVASGWGLGVVLACFQQDSPTSRFHFEASALRRAPSDPRQHQQRAHRAKC